MKNVVQTITAARPLEGVFARRGSVAHQRVLKPSVSPLPLSHALFLYTFVALRIQRAHSPRPFRFPGGVGPGKLLPPEG